MSELDLLSIASVHTKLKRVASTHGGEYAGACPFCGGTDRFRVWSQRNRWWCRQCRKSGDAIALLVELKQITTTDAYQMRRGLPQSTHNPKPSPVCANNEDNDLPNDTWNAYARKVVDYCVEYLWSDKPDAHDARQYLFKRGLIEKTIKDAQLGFLPRDVYRDRTHWGLDGDRKVFLARGIVIPWWYAGRCIKLNVRRLQGEPKYIAVSGSRGGLYNADSVQNNKTVFVVEGELDCLTLIQTAGDVITPVALGSTGGARSERWIKLLSSCPLVLVALDADSAGDAAADFWCNTLHNARRFRPVWSDINDMYAQGVDLRVWVYEALRCCTDITAAQMDMFD